MFFILYGKEAFQPIVQRSILLPSFYDERGDQVSQSVICQSFNIGNTEVLRWKKYEFYIWR